MDNKHSAPCHCLSVTIAACQWSHRIGKNLVLLLLFVFLNFVWLVCFVERDPKDKVIDYWVDFSAELGQYCTKVSMWAWKFKFLKPDIFKGSLVLGCILYKWVLYMFMWKGQSGKSDIFLSHFPTYICYMSLELTNWSRLAYQQTPESLLSAVSQHWD